MGAMAANPGAGWIGVMALPESSRADGAFPCEAWEREEDEIVAPPELPGADVEDGPDDVSVPCAARTRSTNPGVRLIVVVVMVRLVRPCGAPDGSRPAGFDPAAADSYEACCTGYAPGAFAGRVGRARVAPTDARGAWGSGAVPGSVRCAMRDMTILPLASSNRAIKLMRFCGPPTSSHGSQKL